MTWDRVILFSSHIAGYEVDFLALLRYKMKEWAFGDLITLSFACLTQRLCGKAGVTKILDFERWLEMMIISYTSFINYSRNLVLA